MQGTSATTNQCSKTVTSYTSSEILWGQRFQPCVIYDEERDAYCVHNKLFNDTKEVLTPLCSGQRLQEVLMDIIYSAPFYLNNSIKGLTSQNINDEGNVSEEGISAHVNNELKRDIDPNIYNYLNDIKEKLNNSKVQDNTSSCNNVVNSSNNIFDVESLLETLQNFVDEYADTCDESSC